MKKKRKEEQLELFVFIHDTMIIQDQIDLFKQDPTSRPPDDPRQTDRNAELTKAQKSYKDLYDGYGDR